MDNPAMAHLIPSTLLSKKVVLFGNMSEIYQFHKRYSPPRIYAKLSCSLQLLDYNTDVKVERHSKPP